MTAATKPRKLEASAELLELLDELDRIEKRLAKLREEKARQEQLRDDVQVKLAKQLKPGCWRVGLFLVTRTIVRPKSSIDAWAAIEAGVVDEETLKPFFKKRSPFERWTLKRQRT